MGQKLKIINYLAVANTFAEWIEYSLFLFLGPIISKLFFPLYSPESGLLMTYGLFTAAYFIRPISALLFGYFSDKLGRKPPMIIAMLIMGGATLMIGLLPTYEDIGFLAPLMLLLFRILQSISISGEYQSAAIFLMEHEKVNKAFAGSLVIASASGGIFVGGLITALIATSENLITIWRLPFIVTGILTLVIAAFRTKLQETPVFTKMAQNDRIEKNPLISLNLHKSGLIEVVIISAFVSVFVYTCNSYYSTYLINQAGFSITSASLHCSITQLIVTILAPLIAYFFGEQNNDKVLLLGIIGLTINAPIQFYAATIDSHAIIITSLLFYAIFDALVTASIAYYLFNIFPANLKCTGIGFGWNLAAALFGATSPLISANLVNIGFKLAPGILVTGYGIIAIICIRLKAQRILRKPMLVIAAH